MFDFLRQRTRLAVFAIAAVCVTAIPFKLLAESYLPPDDALRHAAKVISGKDWKDILVMRGDIRMDSHPGWHSVLGVVHKVTKGDAQSLVFFSVVALFILFSVPALLLLRRPEAWLAALLVFAVEGTSIHRLMLGRPFIVTMAAFLFICLWWPRLREGKNILLYTIVLSVLVALSTWLHGCWYLFALPVAAFLMARQRRAALILINASLVGIAAGAALTGQPVIFIKQMIQHVVLAFDVPSYLLVSEFTPSGGKFAFVIVVALMLIWRVIRKSSRAKLTEDPVFLLGATAWLLGLISSRVWFDVGLTAFLAWMALEFQEILEARVGEPASKRFLAALVLSVALFLAYTSDGEDRRWTSNLSTEYLYSDNPVHAKWLPDPGGIIYSDDMFVFYQTFFKNPYARWRYALGFEPAWMAPDDLAVYRKLQQFPLEPQYYVPWINKMRPQDRMILTRQPNIPGLEWSHLLGRIWIGRLPRR
ncbi:MAG: hypothetical protein WCG06_00915 [Candidatus Omnitrophota bacterium]